MANRVVGNVLIVDSATINLPYFNMNVRGVALYGTDSTSRLNLTYVSSTLDTVFALGNQINSPGLSGMTFGGPGFAVADTLRVLTLTAGTGYIYFA